MAVYFGGQPDPNITEYVVGPLPQPTYHRDVTVEKYGGKLPYHRRMVLGNEYEQIAKFLLEKKLPEAPTFLKQVFGHNGSTSKLSRPLLRGSGLETVPLGLPGFFLHPVGMELLEGASSLLQWAVLQWLGRAGKSIPREASACGEDQGGVL